jgi:predicted aconitase with swiveling domain
MYVTHKHTHTEGLSFWGGVDQCTGEVIDHTHSLYGQPIGGSILVIPNGRGSCTGSQVVLELLINDKAPAAIVLEHPDVIICTGVLVAEEFFGKTVPVLAVGVEGFAAIGAAVTEGAQYAAVHGACVQGFATQPAAYSRSSEDRASTLDQRPELRRTAEGASSPRRSFAPPPSLQLRKDELAMLQGQGCSQATQVLVHVCAHARTHARTQARTHARARARTYARTHTCTQAKQTE